MDLHRAGLSAIAPMLQRPEQPARARSHRRQYLDGVRSRAPTIQGLGAQAAKAGHQGAVHLRLVQQPGMHGATGGQGLHQGSVEWGAGRGIEQAEHLFVGSEGGHCVGQQVVPGHRVGGGVEQRSDPQPHLGLPFTVSGKRLPIGAHCSTGGPFAHHPRCRAAVTQEQPADLVRGRQPASRTCLCRAEVVVQDGSPGLAGAFVQNLQDGHRQTTAAPGIGGRVQTEQVMLQRPSQPPQLGELHARADAQPVVREACRQHLREAPRRRRATHDNGDGHEGVDVYGTQLAGQVGGEVFPAVAEAQAEQCCHGADHPRRGP